MMTSVRLGLASAWRYRRLVGLVWILFLAAALLAAAPAWRWWNATLSLAPEGDRLLDGLNAALLRELSHADRAPIYAVAFAPMSAFVLVMLVLNPFIAGGLLSVLSADAADGSVVARFIAGGVRRYGLFLRLMPLVGIIGLLLTAVVMSVLLPIGHYVGTADLEQPFLFVAALFPVSLAVVFWFTALLLDIARVRAVRTGERRAWRALIGGLRFIGRHAVATLTLGIVFALLTAAAFGVYVAVACSVTPKSWPAILLAIAWQQALSLTRTALRVSMLGAEVALVAARDPLPPSPPHTSPEDTQPREPEPLADLPPLA
jgi:hypothetical protein